MQTIRMKNVQKQQTHEKTQEKCVIGGCEVEGFFYVCSTCGAAICEHCAIQIARTSKQCMHCSAPLEF